MPIYETKFSDLMRAVNSTLQSARNTSVGGQLVYPKIASVRTFQIGPLAPIAVFPAISLVPETWSVATYFSGGLANMSRTITLYAFVKALKIEQARENLSQLLREARETIQSNFQMKDFHGVPRTFRLTIGAEEFSDVSNPKTSALYQATQELTFMSRDTLPNAEIVGTITETTSKGLMDTLESLFEGAKAQTFINSDGSPMFSEYRYWQEPVLAKLPALALVQSGESMAETFAGTDRITRNFAVNIFTRWGREAKAIFDMLDLSEAVWDFLYKKYAVGGLATDLDFGTVTYGQAEAGNNWLFQTVIPFMCQCRERVQYAA